MQFVFDRDFDGELDHAGRVSDMRAGAIYTREEFDEAVKQARADGYADGRTAGRAEASSASEDSEAERQLAALEAVAPALTALFADADRHHAVLEAQMIDFVLSVLGQVAPQLTATLARDQAEREAADAIRMALGSAMLRVHFPPEAKADGEAHIQRTARLAGFAGRVEVKSDPALAPGDVRAEWDHGVMEYSFNDICQRIFDALEAAKAAAEERAGQAQAGE